MTNETGNNVVRILFLEQRVNALANQIQSLATRLFSLQQQTTITASDGGGGSGGGGATFFGTVQSGGITALSGTTAGSGQVNISTLDPDTGAISFSKTVTCWSNSEDSVSDGTSIVVGQDADGNYIYITQDCPA